MIIILAIDPGTTESAYVLWDGGDVLEKGHLPNDDLFPVLDRLANPAIRLVIEKVESYGMAVGAETFTTVHYAGRFHQHWVIRRGGEVFLLGRKAVKLHLCDSLRAKDSNIRQALIDRFGEPGNQKAPGTLFKISKHLWAALAVAVTAYDQQKNPTEV